MSSELISKQVNPLYLSNRVSVDSNPPKQIVLPASEPQIPVKTNKLPLAAPSTETLKSLGCHQSNDSFVLKNPLLTPTQKYYYKLYNQIWKDTGLPKELMPKAVFKELSSAKIVFGYSFPKGYIAIPKAEERLQHVTFIGKDKFLIAHECRHVRQAFNIARLYGSDKLKEILLNKSHSGNERAYIEKNFNKKFYDKVIKKMGKLDPNSLEGKEAARFAEALSKYKGPFKIAGKYKKSSLIGKLKLYAKYKKTFWEYNHNLLETDANNAAKRFKPSAVKNALKTAKHGALSFFLTVVAAVKKKRI